MNHFLYKVRGIYFKWNTTTVLVERNTKKTENDTKEVYVYFVLIQN